MCVTDTKQQSLPGVLMKNIADSDLSISNFLVVIYSLIYSRTTSYLNCFKICMLILYTF